MKFIQFKSINGRELKGEIFNTPTSDILRWTEEIGV